MNSPNSLKQTRNLHSLHEKALLSFPMSHSTMKHLRTPPSAKRYHKDMLRSPTSMEMYAKNATVVPVQNGTSSSRSSSSLGNVFGTVGLLTASSTMGSPRSGGSSKSGKETTGIKKLGKFYKAQASPRTIKAQSTKLITKQGFLITSALSTAAADTQAARKAIFGELRAEKKKPLPYNAKMTSMYDHNRHAEFLREKNKLMEDQFLLSDREAHRLMRLMRREFKYMKTHS